MAWMARRRCAGCEKTARSSSTSGRRMRSALGLAGMSGADKRSHSPGRRTSPPGLSSHMMPTIVSTAPASRGRQRARTARARGIRPTTVRSAPVRIHLRIRLLRVNGGAPYLPTEPADWLHTTRFRRCDRCLIAAPCHPRLRSACPQWYASALFRSVPRRAVGASAPWSSSSPSELRIMRVSPCVARAFKGLSSLMFANCCWRSLLAVDGGSGASRGHAHVRTRRTVPA